MANRAKQDAYDKSRNVAVPSSIPMQEGRFSVRPGTFVVGIKQGQFVESGMDGNWCFGKELGEKRAGCVVAKTKPIWKCQVRSLKWQVAKNGREVL